MFFIILLLKKLIFKLPSSINNSKAGTLVLFPSYLEHKVGENLSNEERIVVSFNISLIRKKDLIVVFAHINQIVNL